MDKHLFMHPRRMPSVYMNKGFVHNYTPVHFLSVLHIQLAVFLLLEMLDCVILKLSIMINSFQ